VKEPRILLYDIENAPIKAYVWECWQTNVIKVIEPSYLLSFAYKWLGDKRVSFVGLPDFPRYNRKPTCDRSLVTKLHQLFEEADITVAHNGDKSDAPKIRGRFLFHGLPPPSRPKQVDTYRIAKSQFKFARNNLDHLAQHLGIGNKLANTGFDLWERCMGPYDARAWEMMRHYNTHDVVLLEGCYLKMRHYAINPTHPNLSYFTGNFTACPVCQSPNTVRHGFDYCKGGARQRLSCRSCGFRFNYGKVIDR